MGLDQYVDVYPKGYPDFSKEILYYRKNYDLHEYMNEKYGYNYEWYAKDMQLTTEMIEDIIKNTNIIGWYDLNDGVDRIKELWNEALKYSKDPNMVVVYHADW